MPVGEHLKSSPAARAIGSLALSVVRNENPMLALRAAQWRTALDRVALEVPFWAVHDLGLLMVVDPTSVPVGPRPFLAQLGLSGAAGQALQLYTETLQELAESEVLEKARQWRLEDDLISVVLLKVLARKFPAKKVVQPPAKQI